MRRRGRSRERLSMSCSLSSDTTHFFCFIPHYFSLCIFSIFPASFFLLKVHGCNKTTMVTALLRYHSSSLLPSPYPVSLHRGSQEHRFRYHCFNAQKPDEDSIKILMHSMERKDSDSISARRHKPRAIAGSAGLCRLKFSSSNAKSRMRP